MLHYSGFVCVCVIDIISWYNHMIFLLSSVYIMDLHSLILNIEPNLHPWWGGTYLTYMVMVYYSFFCFSEFTVLKFS